MKKLFLPIATLLTLAAVFGSASVIAPPRVYATHVCDPGTAKAGQAIPHTSARAAESFCTGTISAAEAAEANRQADVDCTAENLSSNNCKIYGYIVAFIRGLSAMVGIVVVIMVAVGGIQYSASKDNPQATSAAKNRITNALLALLIYIFMFAFLQWIVPGGVV